MNEILSETFKNDSIDKIRLSNNSGTIIKLECYYRKGKDGDMKRASLASDYYPLGQTRDLNLNDVTELQELVNQGVEVWVTAFANVKAGMDCNCSTWLKYKKGCQRRADFNIKGIVNFTSIELIRVVSEA